MATRLGGCGGLGSVGFEDEEGKLLMPLLVTETRHVNDQLLLTVAINIHNCLRVDEYSYTFPFRNVRNAKLVINQCTFL